MSEILNNAGFTDFTLETLKTPSGVAQLNSILQKITNNIAGDTDQVRVFTCIGTPEGQITASVGSLAMRSDGGSGTSVYAKESGSGNTGWVAITPNASLPLSVANGGTGSDLSASAQGTILYFSATGVISVLAVGTNGQFLKTQGSGANPVWAYPAMSQPVIFKWGQIDALTTTTEGIVSSETTLTPATPSIDAPSGKYVYWKFNGTSYANIYDQEPVYFRKRTGINTVSGTFYLWEQSNGAGAGGGRQVSCYVDIGSQVSSTLTSQSSTPTSKSWSVDVSGLTNDTVYEIKLMARDDVQGGNNTVGFVAKMIGFES